MKKIVILWSVLLLSSIAVFSQTPYNIVMNITQNPSTQMAFNWFTTSNTTNEQVQIVIGTTTNPASFTTPFKTVNATTNQNVHKAIVSGLSPNTTYSFRVGKTNLWSNIGTFKTAPAPENKAPFSFVYVTDSHAEEALQPQTNAADKKNPNANFWLHCGDMIRGENTDPIGTILERWKKFLDFQPSQILKKPLAPVMGNHDLIHNNLFNSHFNVQNESFDATGSTYSFIYGDAQFFAINSERWNNTTYFNGLKTWMQDKMDNSVRWHIIYCHQLVYYPEYMNSSIAQLCDDFNIDLVLQGHTHVYSVMGPIKNRSVIPESVKYVTFTDTSVASNGKSGGLFNVQEGTMYFTNGTFGLKWFPKNFAGMSADNAALVTGKGATGNGATGFTYSNVSVSSNNITITTYKTNNGESEPFDEIKLVKECIPSLTTSGTIIGTQSWDVSQDKSGNITIPNGVTLTVTANITASNCSVITIENGGKLIINGGTIDGATIVAKSGSTCTIQNNGKILLKKFDDFDIQSGATFDLISGEVSPK